MGKKKRKKASRGSDYADFPPAYWNGQAAHGGYGQYGADPAGHDPDHRFRKGGPAGLFNAEFLKGLPGLPSRQTEQFLLGALIGAAATYVLSDEELRGKLVKMGIKLYSGLVGGFEEMKEQMADLKAEVEAERQGEA